MLTLKICGYRSVLAMLTLKICGYRNIAVMSAPLLRDKRLARFCVQGFPVNSDTHGRRIPKSAGILRQMFYAIAIASSNPNNSILREVSPNMLFNFLPLPIRTILRQVNVCMQM